MTQRLQLALMFLYGAGLGALYFGGLAYTVRRLVAGGGALLVVGSFLVRGAALIAGFWLVARDRAEIWVACLLGFTVVKMALSRAPSLKAWFVRREDDYASHH